jgi:alkanesulfonate monooxygenase SsuD/methylene tetrahydromethanopterin reductase-like flavin-dependent oxidoreductase (luciferase family)
MHYGISVPNFGDYFLPQLVAELAHEAEESGWNGFFVWDHVLFWNDGRLPMNDPWITLAAVAMRTNRIRLGTLVTPIARRRPWKLARETVSLDHLSNGRLILGVGLGHPPQDDFARFGEDPNLKARARKLDEGLAILVGLWSGQPFTYAGDTYQLQAGTQFVPEPVQTPRIPIWVAGYLPHQAPFRRAAQWDGVCPGRWDDQPMTPDDLRAVLSAIGQHRTARTPFDVVMGLPTDGADCVAAAAQVAPFIDAGLTWWVEPLDSERGSLEVIRQRIWQGPPKLP